MRIMAQASKQPPCFLRPGLAGVRAAWWDLSPESLQLGKEIGQPHWLLLRISAGYPQAEPSLVLYREGRTGERRPRDKCPALQRRGNCYKELHPDAVSYPNSTENYSQYLVITYNRKHFRK